MYLTRKLKVGNSEQLDELARAAGELYSRTLIIFWRIVRRKGIWLSPGAMEKICNSKKLHAHSADAAVQSFYQALSSWRMRRRIDQKTRPPHKRRIFYRVQWKKTALRLKNGILILSNGKGNKPLEVPWNWQLPVLVTMIYDGREYVLHVTYAVNQKAQPLGDRMAGVDLGEVHPAVVYDGEHTYIVNGRSQRSLKRQRNKTFGTFQKLRSTKKEGSRQDEKLKEAQKRQSKKLENQIRDISHKQTTQLVSTLYTQGVHTVVMGDLTSIRLNSKDLGKKANQKVHQMLHGTFRHYISYKAALYGMEITLINEAYTSQECPVCSTRNKPKNRNYACACGFTYHRDGVGAINILRKYRGESHVVGVMAPPISLRYDPHMKCSLH